MSEELATQDFDCEAGDDSFTVCWPDGRWLIAERSGQIRIGKSPFSPATPMVTTTLPALIDHLEADGGVEAMREALEQIASLSDEAYPGCCQQIAKHTLSALPVLGVGR